MVSLLRPMVAMLQLQCFEVKDAGADRVGGQVGEGLILNSLKVPDKLFTTHECATLMRNERSGS